MRGSLCSRAAYSDILVVIARVIARVIAACRAPLPPVHDNDDFPLSRHENLCLIVVVVGHHEFPFANRLDTVDGLGEKARRR
jgi:hypothetical protein